MASERKQKQEHWVRRAAQISAVSVLIICRLGKECCLSETSQADQMTKGPPFWQVFSRASQPLWDLRVSPQNN